MVVALGYDLEKRAVLKVAGGSILHIYVPIAHYIELYTLYFTYIAADRQIDWLQTLLSSMYIIYSCGMKLE